MNEQGRQAKAKYICGASVAHVAPFWALTCPLHHPGLQPFLAPFGPAASLPLCNCPPHAPLVLLYWPRFLVRIGLLLPANDLFVQTRNNTSSLMLSLNLLYVMYKNRETL